MSHMTTTVPPCGRRWSARQHAGAIGDTGVSDVWQRGRPGPIASKPGLLAARSGPSDRRPPLLDVFDRLGHALSKLRGLVDYADRPGSHCQRVDAVAKMGSPFLGPRPPAVL